MALAIVGIPVSSVAAYLAAQVIASAWQACTRLDAGDRFGLFGLAIGIAVLAWIAFVAGAIAVRRFAIVWRLGVALVLVLLVCGFAMRENVPLGSAADDDNAIIRPSPTPIEFADTPFSQWLAPAPDAVTTCGSGGVPTWWPWWLPHQ